ncbi:MAG: hypothetical protein KatS3mg119_0413 [Rhodothalassiaceae bacterium]|nr:MAG: hypothetical protein KatS3mg119_0413 [Rhodothalassiaceae bacterium]
MAARRAPIRRLAGRSGRIEGDAAMTWKYWLWYLFAPSLWGVYLIALGVLLEVLGRPGRLRRWAAAGLVYTLLMGFMGGWWLVARPLEDAARALARPAEPGAGILILGGAEDLIASTRAGELVTGEEAERIIAGLALAAAHPHAPVFYASGDLAPGAAAVRGRLAALFGQLLGPGREIVVDGSSRDTCDNLAAVRRYEARHGRRGWILVTSALHMPRAVLCAQARGVRVLPHPVDWRAPGSLSAYVPTARPIEALRDLDDAAHEWVGLVHYRLAGRIRKLWPAGGSADPRPVMPPRRSPDSAPGARGTDFQPAPPAAPPSSAGAASSARPAAARRRD